MRQREGATSPSIQNDASNHFREKLALNSSPYREKLLGHKYINSRFGESEKITIPCLFFKPSTKESQETKV